MTEGLKPHRASAYRGRLLSMERFNISGVTYAYWTVHQPLFKYQWGKLRNVLHMERQRILLSVPYCVFC